MAKKVPLLFPSSTGNPSEDDRLQRAAVATVKRYAPQFLDGPLLQGRVKAEDAAESMALAASSLYEEWVSEHHAKRVIIERYGGGPEPTSEERAEATRMRLAVEHGSLVTLSDLDTDEERTEKMEISKAEERVPVSMAQAIELAGFEYQGTRETTAVWKRTTDDGEDIELGLEGNAFVIGSTAQGLIAAGVGRDELSAALTEGL